jgi:hypothetical protein
MTQFLADNPYYADAYGFQGDALIYREAAGLFCRTLSIATLQHGEGSAGPRIW